MKSCRKSHFTTEFTHYVRLIRESNEAALIYFPNFKLSIIDNITCFSIHITSVFFWVAQYSKMPN